MAAHRAPSRPSPRWAERAARAETPEDRLAVSYDRLRAVLAHLTRRQRDPAKRAADVAHARQLADSAARFLASLCEAEGDRQ